MLNDREAISCAVTGHRPFRFPFKYNEQDVRCKRLKDRIREQLMLLYQHGVRRFYLGGAIGTDLWTGEILLELKEQGCDEIEIMLALPFEGYNRNWDKTFIRRLNTLIRHSTKTVIVSTGETTDGYRKRNQYMVDRADYLLAVYDNRWFFRSGTGSTVRYAQSQGRTILLIHPDTTQVSYL